MTRSEAPKAPVPKWVYLFGAGMAEGDADMKALLGGKGANLAEMASLGLPVPPGFTITTEVCDAYYARGRQIPAELKPQVEAALAKIGEAAGAKFGDESNPLLVAVRSGARASMPGMMDTILNLGLNDKTVRGLAKRAGDERFAYDSYRRFIQMYADVVLGIDHGVFEDILDNYKNLNGLSVDTDLEGRRLAGGHRELQGGDRGRARASPFPRIRASRSGAPSGPCSAPGRTRAPSPTAACTPFPTIGARRSTCRRWCSATWARPRPPASPSRAIRRRA